MNVYTFNQVVTAVVGSADWAGANEDFLWNLKMSYASRNGQYKTIAYYGARAEKREATIQHTD